MLGRKASKECRHKRTLAGSEIDVQSCEAAEKEKLLVSPRAKICAVYHKLRGSTITRIFLSLVVQKRQS